MQRWLTNHIDQLIVGSKSLIQHPISVSPCPRPTSDKLAAPTGQGPATGKNLVTAQGSSSFKDRKAIGEVCLCDWRQSEPTDRKVVEALSPSLTIYPNQPPVGVDQGRCLGVRQAGIYLA